MEEPEMSLGGNCAIFWIECNLQEKIILLGDMNGQTKRKEDKKVTEPFEDPPTNENGNIFSKYILRVSYWNVPPEKKKK